MSRLKTAADRPNSESFASANGFIGASTRTTATTDRRTPRDTAHRRVTRSRTRRCQKQAVTCAADDHGRPLSERGLDPRDREYVHAASALTSDPSTTTPAGISRRQRPRTFPQFCNKYVGDLLVDDDAFGGHADCP